MKENPRQLTIGKLSRQTGVNIETIRYYEKAGLMPNPPRSEGGHRLYRHDHLRRLTFIRRCRELGFAMSEVQELLGLVDAHGYTCGEVQALTLEHAKNVRGKRTDLRRMEKTLRAIASECSGSNVPDCPIIDALFDPEESAVLRTEIG